MSCLLQVNSLASIEPSLFLSAPLFQPCHPASLLLLLRIPFLPYPQHEHHRQLFYDVLVTFTCDLKNPDRPCLLTLAPSEIDG
jgi:hypothetical protein